MSNFKVVISDPKSRKAYQKEADQGTSGLRGKKIGDKISGEFLGLQGYKLEITGGSDNDGFPMRRDVEGTARKRILLSSGPGFHSKTKGQRKRKSIRGNIISSETAQINVKVTDYGSQPVEKLLGVQKEEPKEKPAETKEEPKKKPTESKEETKPEAAETKQEPEKAEEKPKPEEQPEKKAEEKMGVKELGEEGAKKEEPEKKEEDKKK